MSETRIMPKATPRSTGIARVATQPVRTHNGSSAAVTTAPGVGREIHDYVHSRGQQQPPARSRMDQSLQAPTPPAAPAPASRQAAPARVAAPAQGTLAQAATVAPQAAPAAVQTFPAGQAPAGQRPIQRIVAGGGQAQVTQRPAVQLIDRSKGAADAGPAASPFTIEQMMLIAHLLEKFAEGEAAVAVAGGDNTVSRANANTANAALAVMTRMMNATYAPPGAQVEAAPEPVLATSAAPRVTIVAAPSPTARGASAEVVGTTHAPTSPAAFVAAHQAPAPAHVATPANAPTVTILPTQAAATQVVPGAPAVAPAQATATGDAGPKAT